MSPLVDTNILLYSVDPKFPEQPAASAAIDSLRQGTSPWFLTWGIVYEFLRVATHPAVFTRALTVAEAVSFLKPLLNSAGLGILRETDEHLSLLRQEILSMPDIHGNDLHDAHTVVLMREHGLQTIWTADRGFRRFRGIQVVDPVHA